MDSAFQSIAHYHEETKHHYHRYARSAEYMDWENQPQPFRFYREAPIVELPLLKQDPAGGHGDLYRPNSRPVQDARLTTYPAYHHLQDR